MLSRSNRNNLICGLAVAGIGLYALATGLSLDLGSMRRIGPGAFPALIGGLMTLAGLFIVFFEQEAGSDPQAKANLRGLFMVLAGLAAFAALIRTAGMVPSIFAAVTLSSYADPNAKLRDALAVSAFMSVLAIAVFIYGLGFQARAFGAY